VASDASEEILFERKGDWGVVTLNRPKALNALNKAMCETMAERLRAWATDDGVGAVLLRGAGERAFCAGGDIRYLWEGGRSDPRETAEFFRKEYELDALIHHYPKPVVAALDGVTMGGGVGISAHAPYRLVGDNTMWAMPETGIGLFPDVGACYVLPRLPGAIGMFLALTGQRLKAFDCCYAEIATHAFSGAAMSGAVKALLDQPLAGGAHDAIRHTLDAHADDCSGDVLSTHRTDIDRHFGEATLEKVLASLEADGGDWAQETLKTLNRMSPTSLKLTFAHVKWAADQDFDAVIKRDFRIASRLITTADFQEGVRAQIIDKDRNPKWAHGSIADVPDTEIEAFWAPFEDGRPDLSLEEGFK